MTIFAQVAVEDFASGVREYQSGPNSGFVVFVVVVLGALAALLVTWRVLAYRKTKRRPLLLFYDLAEEFRISKQDQKRLLAFARAHGVADPAYLFVCPELVGAIQSSELKEASGDKERERIEQIFRGFQKAAFGGDAPPGGER